MVGVSSGGFMPAASQSSKDCNQIRQSDASDSTSAQRYKLGPTYCQAPDSGAYTTLAEQTTITAPLGASYFTGDLPTFASPEMGNRPQLRSMSQLETQRITQQSPWSSTGSSNTPTTESSRRVPSSRTSADASSSANNESRTRRQSSSTEQNQEQSTSSPKKKRAKKDKTIQIKEEEDDNRSKFLERNRVAASKCRQKKKVWVSDLEETKHGLQNQNSRLQTEYSGLIDEINTMKTHLMSHAGCHDPMIDQWIENEARKYVQKTSDQYDQMGIPTLPGGEYCSDPSQSRQSSMSQATMNEGISPYSRRGSMGYTLTSPTIYQNGMNPSTSGGPSIPSFGVTADGELEDLELKEEFNFDHMPDNLFEAA